MEPGNFQIEKFVTQGGVTLDLNLVYVMHGHLNEAKDNCILVPTSYSATHEDAEDLFASSDVLDLSDYCVVVINMLSNSESSSPSNTRRHSMARGFR